MIIQHPMVTLYSHKAYILWDLITSMRLQSGVLVKSFVATIPIKNSQSLDLVELQLKLTTKLATVSQSMVTLLHQMLKVYTELSVPTSKLYQVSNLVVQPTSALF